METEHNASPRRIPRKMLTTRFLTAIVTICLGLLCLPLAALAEVTGTCERPFEIGFPAGGRIGIHVRSADVAITGVDRHALRVTCVLKQTEQRKDVSIRFHGSGNNGDLSIQGGPHDDIHFLIELPRQTSLFVRSPAGNMEVSGIAGDKDIELYAGDLTISVGNPADYFQADASVTAGDLSASAFTINKSGLFRSFTQYNKSGKYRLHAHLMAGDMTLR
jgi:hypothetical protein